MVDAEAAPLKENSRIQIPLTKKVFDSLPIEDKYKAARWDMAKLSDDLGIIDPTTNQPYLSEKGKQMLKTLLRATEKAHSCWKR